LLKKYAVWSRQKLIFELKLFIYLIEINIKSFNDLESARFLICKGHIGPSVPRRD